jgi:hypothetical protein
VFVDLPLGHTTGVLGDPAGPRRLLTDGLMAAIGITEPGTIVDLPYRYVDDRWKADPLGWSRRRQTAGDTGSAAGDTRAARSAEPRYQSEDDRLAAEGVNWDDQCQVCLGLPSPS